MNHEAAPKAVQPASAAAKPLKPSLNDIIKESNNVQAEGIKKEIDEMRKQKGRLISKAKEFRRRYSYKESEFASIDRLLKVERDPVAEAAARKRFGYLKKMINKFEFRISTEAKSLNEEKELIRKINEMKAELNESLKFVRMERKLELVKKDIEMFKNSLIETDKAIADLDLKMDGKYVELRKSLGIGSWQSGKPQSGRDGRPMQHRKKAPQSAPSQEVNLEDIVVIKKKAAK